MNSTPTHLLFVDHATDLGGAEHSLLMILDRLDPERWAPHLACQPGPLAERAAALGIPIHHTPLPRLRRSLSAVRDLAGGARALARMARETGAALVIANTVRAAFYAAPAARWARVPFVWYRRDFWLGESEPSLRWADTAIKALLGALSAHIIANSQATMRRHPLQHKISVVPNGIDVTRYDPSLDGGPFRQAYRIPPGAPLIGVVGRLAPPKGQDRFLRILARVRADMPEVWGVIVGGPLFGQEAYNRLVRQMAQELGLADRVVFTGQMNDPAPALAAMDLFVQPGDPEAFGLVHVEAMAMAKPLVGFAHGALPEIAIEGETALLVAPGDEAALAHAALDLLRDPDRGRRQGEAGRERALQAFTIERTVRHLDAILSELVAKR
jgi:glycosyltransferase involved in cell wall biosynthesis